MATFYAKYRGLSIQIRPETYAFGQDGKAITMPGKSIRFSPIGASGNIKGGSTHNYGCLQTDDPEAVEFLEKRIADGLDDVMTEEKYLAVTTPPEVQVAEQKTTIQKLQERLAVLEAFKAKTTGVSAAK